MLPNHDTIKGNTDKTHK